jgi:hypothetical protein
MAFEQAIRLIEISPRNASWGGTEDVTPRMFIVVLFIMRKKQKQRQCPSIGELINLAGCICTGRRGNWVLTWKYVQDNIV